MLICPLGTLEAFPLTYSDATHEHYEAARQLLSLISNTQAQSVGQKVSQHLKIILSLFSSAGRRRTSDRTDSHSGEKDALGSGHLSSYRIRGSYVL